jgi:CTP synthase
MLVEMVELPADMHPWFVGTQAHPEFKSRPNRPSPLYRDFVGAALVREERMREEKEFARPTTGAN